MLDATGILGLLMLWLLGGDRGSSARGGGGGGAAPRQRPTPQLPAGQQTSAPPWPERAPPGLPPFPGAGWQFDEPPPAAVVQRAKQLVDQLWQGGAGTFRIEQTAGRWIAYRAEVVATGKKGVVAYRVKAASSTPAPATRAPDRRASTSVPSLQTILASTVPAAAGAKVVRVLAGHWYQFSMLMEGPPGLASEIARGLGLGGAVNIAVSETPPYAIGFQMKVQRTGDLPLGQWFEIKAGDVTVRAQYLRIVEIEDPTKEQKKPPTKPQPPKEKLPPGVLVSTAPAAPALRTLPTLRRGDGIKPKPPNPDVKLMQQKLGVAADGQFGAGTENALKAYQRSHALDADGVCGPKTWTSLLAGF